MTGVIAVPETVSAAKGQPGGMQAVRVCVCLSARRSHLSDRSFGGGFVHLDGQTIAINNSCVRVGRVSSVSAPPFPLRKHKVGPHSTTHPTHPLACLLAIPTSPPTTFSSVWDSASLNLANPRPGIILPSLLPRESRRHIVCTRIPLESKHARRGELSWALARPKLSSIEPLFPHVERASVKLCRNTAQRSAATTGVRRPSRPFLISLNLASTPWAMTRSNGDLSHC